MVQMLFFLRFRSQLRRTRPDLVSSLEDTISGAIFTAGGRISDNRRFLNASFDSDRVGFWLDILILIETVKDALEKAGSELSGHALIFNTGINEDEAERLCHKLSSGEAAAHTGIWCGEPLINAMRHYCFFEKPFGDYSELIKFKTYKANPELLFPYREKIMRVLDSAQNENTLLLGSLSMGIRDGIYEFSNQTIKNDIPPLIIRFDSDCICDVLTPQIRALLAKSPSANMLPELDALGQLLFRERLRSSLPPFIAEAERRYFDLLLRSYMTLAQVHKSGQEGNPVLLIIEEPALAKDHSIQIFKDVYTALENKEELFIIGVNTNDSEDWREWNSVFSRVLKFQGDDFTDMDWDLSELPGDLWELLYAFTLLRNYFPAFLFPQIFREEGINPGILERALEMLSLLGIIDSVQDPRPRIPGFQIHAEKKLGERKEKIKALVGARLLAWELNGKIRPCFNLLCALYEMGCHIDDPLILRTLRCDISNGTFEEMGESFSKKQFGFFTKKENVSILEWIFNTQKALVQQCQNEIRLAFNELPPPLPAGIFPGFRAQIEASLSAYRLGIKDVVAAAETVKELMLQNQSLKDGGIPAYRYFSFLNLYKQKIDDTLEYSTFAMDLAEKTGRDELVKASYFASSSQFIYGNLAAAERLILKAEKTALNLGWLHWALRSRFFLGRIRFENGHYKEALDLFTSLEGKVPLNAEKTLAAWIYRSSVYLDLAPGKGRTKNIMEPDLSISGSMDDYKVFILEAAYLKENFEEAVNIGNEYLKAVNQQAESLDHEPDFFYTEQPDWRSGFSQCEYMLMPPKTLLNRLASVYHILAQSRLPMSPEMCDTLRNRIQNLVREELLQEWDTNDVFYFYAWYEILKNVEASQGDASRAVSMAYKRLQRRSSRIDTTESRHNYLTLNYWNNALGIAARENKLI